MKSAFFTIILIAFLVLPPARASITEEGGGIVYGGNFVYSLKAPKGWVLDNESGASQGAHAVFYAKGGTWKTSMAVAYASARPRDSVVKTADDAAKAVVDDFHAHGSPKYESKRVKTIKADEGAEGAIYHFSGDQWGNYEAVAYFVEEKTINYIVLTSRQRAAFEEALPAFEKLAASYFYIGDKVVEEGKPQVTPAKKKKAAK